MSRAVAAALVDVLEEVGIKQVFGLILLNPLGDAAWRSKIDCVGVRHEERAALGRACGAQGFAVRDPALLESTLIEAFACPGPAIVACGVATDEMPNLPHVKLERLGGYSVAKSKEAIAALTGG